MTYQIPTQIPQQVFRAYDIRGIVDDPITDDFIYGAGLAIGSEVRQFGETHVVVARDGRLSAERLIEALTAGLLHTGCNVVDIGAVPTPVLYFGTYFLPYRSGVMLTASHNPADYNGLKIVVGGSTLSGDGIQAICHRMEKGDFSRGQGALETRSITEQYYQRIVEDVTLERPLKIVLDCGNGIAGAIAPELFKRLGCKVIPIYCDVDGRFPNHHPDPTILSNLETMIDKVRREKADIGIALDGDGDRLGIVDDQGRVLWPDRQMMLYAAQVLKEKPGGEIVFDVKCTGHLPKVIEKLGGKATIWKTGHSMIKHKLHESGALLAGEMSGHIFFNDRWYGFDDGLYTGARLLEILAKDPRPCHEIFDELPDSINTPEIKVAIEDHKKFEFVTEFIERGEFPQGDCVTVDGLRVNFNDGWGLLRASNTTPCLTLRFEGETEGALLRIQTLFKEQMLKVEPELEIPF